MPETGNENHVDFSKPIPEASEMPDLQLQASADNGLQSNADNSLPAPAYAPTEVIGPVGSTSHSIRHAAQRPEFTSQSPVSSPKRSHGQPTLPLETPPQSSGFEWDERTGKGSDKFVDGMASLTSAANEGGYLGIRSALPTNFEQV